MTVSKLPNIQKLLSEFLRGHPEVEALVGERIYTTLPAGHNTWPAVRLTRIGGSAIPPARVMDRPIVQIDCWGGPKAVALDVAETIAQVIAEELPGRHADGYVYGGDSVVFGPLRDMPDTTFDPARPRFVFDVTLLTRAARGPAA